MEAVWHRKGLGDASPLGGPVAVSQTAPDPLEFFGSHPPLVGRADRRVELPPDDSSVDRSAPDPAGDLRDEIGRVFTEVLVLDVDKARGRQRSAFLPELALNLYNLLAHTVHVPQRVRRKLLVETAQAPLAALQSRRGSDHWFCGLGSLRFN